MPLQISFGYSHLSILTAVTADYSWPHPFASGHDQSWDTPQSLEVYPFPSPCFSVEHLMFIPCTRSARSCVNVFALSFLLPEILFLKQDSTSIWFFLVLTVQSIFCLLSWTFWSMFLFKHFSTLAYIKLAC